ncbi:dienelactone hydrolase family protein [Pseudonocardia sp. GCM10023141]|uniref:dienelactone hydrolase family protein n=1 Tax=Pseudonocardia sp. GCM10023141 TaxID=3252653 RepID=UPI003615CE02
MTRIDVTVPTPDGECPATLHVPDGGSPAPAVILYVDAGGFRETMRVMGDRIAEMGYVALVPDVYYRAGDWAPFDLATVFSDPEQRTRMFSLMGQLTGERIGSDTGAFLDFLASRPEVAGTKVGTTGYCMGGRASLIAAGHHGDRIAAAASFHGGNLAATDNPDSPHLRADHIGATVYVAGATDDGSFPAEQFERLDEALTAAGVAHTIETYPAGHGFAVPDNPTYDATAEERHWKALEQLYGSVLSG